MSENPLLAPIQGITLEDYSAACAKMGSGLSEEQVAKALGVAMPVWQEANLGWQERMKEDTTYQIVTLFGQHFGTADQHPKFSNLQAVLSPEATAYVEKIKTDKDFYQELEVARQVAYDHGLDGAGWVADQYGISIGDFQIAASIWNEQIHQDIAADSQKYVRTQDAYKEKYNQHFANNRAGDVAGDIEF